MVQSCCVPECPLSRWKKKISYFQFPTQPEIVKKWINEICLNPQVKKEKLHICSIYFKKEDFQLISKDSNTTRGVCKKKLERKRLLPHAIPSLHLRKTAVRNAATLNHTLTKISEIE